MAEIPRTGHRERLRQKFQSAPRQMAEVELLELLLTYAIPRQDVAPLAAQLLDRFGSLRTLLAASQVELTEVPGVGDATAVLLQLVGQLRRAGSFAAETAASSAGQPQGSAAPLRQPALFPDSPEDREKEPNTPKPPPPPPTKSDIRAYTNDLIAAALTHLPQVVNYREFSEFFAYLEKSLPYNSANTRKRYTNYLTNRYFPGGPRSSTSWRPNSPSPAFTASTPWSKAHCAAGCCGIGSGCGGSCTICATLAWSAKSARLTPCASLPWPFDQRAALRHYFEHPRRGEMALRETAVTETPTS
jgi:hypothetical protein